MDINVLVLLKKNERYVFLYADGQERVLQRTLGRFATTPDLSFSWEDAVILTHRIQQELDAR